MQETFEYYEGYLCLKSVDVMYSKPAMLTVYYPFLQIPRNDIAHLIGAKAYPVGGQGSYCYKSVDSVDARWFRLQNLGQTKPLHTREEPIPCPRVRKGIKTRWESWHWQKLLKQGWVPA